jgi:hypothetical protein
MTDQPSYESVAIEALLRLLQGRYGHGYVLRRVMLDMDGPDGIGQSVSLDPARWYAIRQPAPADQPHPWFRHSPDFRSVSWGARQFTFTPLQAAVVKQLWEAFAQGTPAVGGDCLLENAGSDVESRRLDLVFRGHEAWQTLIVAAGKGLYQIVKPA